MSWPASVDRLREAMAQPVLRPMLAGALAAFWIVTAGDRAAFGVPFLLWWAAFVAAFYIGWAACDAARRRFGRLRALAASPVALRASLAGAAMLVLAIATALAWYLVSRRAIGVLDQAAVIWASAIVALAVVGGAAVRWRRPQVGALMWLLPVQVVGVWIAVREYLRSGDMGLYDFEVYLAGGRRFLEGAWPYLTAPLEQLPPTAAQDVFLYPPPLLPFFGWLSQVPEPLRSQAWIGLILVAAVPALRLIGVRWAWVGALMLFPPLIKGVESGNVANLTFLIFAAGAVLPALLPIGVLFKPQFAIPSLWLLRERLWGSVLVSAVVVALIVALSMPLLGIELWFGWAEGLRHREASQHDFPLLFGYSLAQYVPLAVFVALSLVAVVVPLFMRGTRSLAGLGLATIVAAPSLWPHGFVFAFPALFALEAPLVWFALGVADGPWLWVLVVAGYLGLAVGQWDRHEPITDPTHPLVGTTGVWRREAAPTDRA